MSATRTLPTRTTAPITIASTVLTLCSPLVTLMRPRCHRHKQHEQQRQTVQTTGFMPPAFLVEPDLAARGHGRIGHAASGPARCAEQTANEAAAKMGQVRQ